MAQTPGEAWDDRERGRKGDVPETSPKWGVTGLWVAVLTGFLCIYYTCVCAKRTTGVIVVYQLCIWNGGRDRRTKEQKEKRTEGEKNKRRKERKDGRRKGQKNRRTEEWKREGFRVRGSLGKERIPDKKGLRVKRDSG